MTYEDNTNRGVVVDNGVVAEAVEPERSPLRWLWWLLGLLALAGLIWGLTRACRPVEEHPVAVVTETEHVEEPEHVQEVTTLPAEAPVTYDHVNIAEADLTHLREEVHGYDAELSDSIDDNHFHTGFQHLCAAHLNHTDLHEGLAGHFGLAEIATSAADHIVNLVSDAWCHRP